MPTEKQKHWASHNPKAVFIPTGDGHPSPNLRFYGVKDSLTADRTTDPTDDDTGTPKKHAYTLNRPINGSRIA